MDEKMYVLCAERTSRLVGGLKMAFGDGLLERVGENHFYVHWREGVSPPSDADGLPSFMIEFYKDLPNLGKGESCAGCFRY